MSRFNSLELFDEDKTIVVAQNFSLPQLDGSQLTGLVSKINNQIGNIQIVAGSGLVTIATNNEKQISIDVDIPNIASLFVQLNGSDVIADTYTITYNKTKYLVVVRHNLNARVVGFLFDQNDKQAFYGIDYIDNNTVSIQFEEATFPNASNIWKLSLGLGGGLPITLSTQMPSVISTDTTVTSSNAVYKFVKNEISVVNEQFEQFKIDTNEQFQTIDDNFDTVSQAFVDVRNEFTEADQVLDNKINVQIERINGIVLDISNMMKQMSNILDEINGQEAPDYIVPNPQEPGNEQPSEPSNPTEEPSEPGNPTEQQSQMKVVVYSPQDMFNQTKTWSRYSEMDFDCSVFDPEVKDVYRAWKNEQNGVTKIIYTFNSNNESNGIVQNNDYAIVVGEFQRLTIQTFNDLENGNQSIISVYGIVTEVIGS